MFPGFFVPISRRHLKAHNGPFMAVIRSAYISIHAPAPGLYGPIWAAWRPLKYAGMQGLQGAKMGLISIFPQGIYGFCIF